MTEKGTILLVEDEVSIRKAAQMYLEHVGFRVVSTGLAVDVLPLTRQECPDLIVLDLNLPDGDGMEVTARLRQESDVYVLMLTARTDEADRVAGLRIGADDYLTKPFSIRELAARIEAILRCRRSGVREPDRHLRFTHVEIDPERREAAAHGQPMTLTTTEFDVLLALARHVGKVLSREQLISVVWGGNFYGTDRVVDVYVGQVRRKLEVLTNQQLICTVRGRGYKFVDSPHQEQGGQERAVNAT